MPRYSGYGIIILNAETVAGLPAVIPNQPGTTGGGMSYVTDGDSGLTWGSTVVNTGSGATPYLVWFNGTNWVVVGSNGLKALSPSVTDTITVGYTVTPFNGGTVSSGTFTPAAANGNYQFYTNDGAHSFAVPAADSAVDVLITNGASAGAISFSGSYKGGSHGDSLTTTLSDQFIVSVRRINGISAYIIKALQ